MQVETLQSEAVFEGKVFRVRRDRVRYLGGAEADFDVVEHPGAVTMVPIDDEGRMWFVRQYRHPVGTSLLEFPAGTLEDKEDPEACARRECREEIGVEPGELLLLGSCYLAPGYSSELNHLFLARDLQASPLAGDEHEDIEIEIFTVDEVYDLIASGGLQDAKTLAALLLALPLVDEGI
jgi:ADP-ribose pyrophosphatase